MIRKFVAIAASVVSGLLASIGAGASDLAEGEALYITQCKLCHGSLDPQAASAFPVRPEPIQLAMLDDAWTRKADSMLPLISSSGHATGPLTLDGQLAFAPPFGPNLRGVVGRPAGSVEGFQYSKTMLKTLKGMEWTEAALNVWITNPQAWVPGVFMYYKQDDPEIRRKIILYLKANP
jgi:cytochrome c2